MIASIKGRLLQRGVGSVVVECGGVGLSLAASSHTISQLSETGSEVFLFSHLIVRDDSLQLYGFGSEDERELFLMLLGVQAVGPKVALAVLSAGSPTDMATAIVSGDSATFQRVPGIGKRTAERIIVELKDKLANQSILQAEVGTVFTGGPAAEAQAALIGLGFSAGEAAAMLTDAEGHSTEDLVSSALKNRGTKL